MDLRCIHLLIYCLNLLEEKVRQRFTYCLDHHLIDRAFNDMIETDQFPKWFSEEFHYDPLYGRLGGVRECLSIASANGLLRMDGTNFNYHLELSERLMSHLQSQIGLPQEHLRSLAYTLNTKVRELLNKKHPPA